jgi:putative Mg2+ transporter-C (MgtC) family protein
VLVLELVLSSVMNSLYIFVRLIIAAILGGVIGLEREKLNRPAGVRTHMIVCLGSCLIMLLGEYMHRIDSTIDITRLGAQVVSGIGFLGAGAILKDGFSVRGLTTAATLWVVACVGLAIGGGFYSAGILTTLIVYSSLHFLGFTTKKGLRKNISVYVESLDNTINNLQDFLTDNGLEVVDIGLVDNIKHDFIEIKFIVLVRNIKILTELESKILSVEGVKSVHIEK